MEQQGGNLKPLQIIYKAFLLGQLFFVAIVILLFLKGILTPAVTGETANIFFYGAIVLSAVSVGMSYKLFGQRLELARQEATAENKINLYRAAFLLQLALCEAPALFVIIIYFLTQNTSLLILLALLLLNFARLYPTRSKIIQQLELDQDEESILD